MFKISEDTKRNIERATGLSLYQLSTLTLDKEKEWFESRHKRKLLFSKRRHNGVVGRGNPLLARKKIRTFEDLEKRENKLFKK